ncbi:MAG TPA: tetratricopeptide repeat protein [Thermoanaerobaculia bacterium]
MKMCSLILAAVLSLSGVAQAQDFPSEPYEFILAKLAASDGRHAEALGLMDKVIAKHPKEPTLLFERAMMLIDAGRMERAEGELRAVVKDNPEFYDAQRFLGRVLLDRAGTDRAKIDEALQHLQAAFKINPDDLSTGVAISQLLLSAGRTAEAERVLATLVERAPDQRTLNYNYAQILTKLGRRAEAKQYLEKTVQLDATFGPAILQLLEFYEDANEFEKAANVLQPLLDEDPLNVELQRQQAAYWLRAGNAARARAGFEQLVKIDPKDQRSQYFLAEALNDLNEHAEAEKIYARLLQQTPDDLDLLLSYGLSLAGQQKWDPAKQTFDKLLRQPGVPDNVAALARTQLAYIDLQQGQYDSAIETAKTVFSFRDKPNSQAVNIAVEALRKQKKYREAVELLAPLVEKYPNDALVSSRYLEALVRSGETEKAKALAATQVKLGTRNTIATAEAYILAGDNTSAISLIKEGLKAKPDELDLQFQLASTYERAENNAEAEKQFLAILEKHPDHAATLNYLGYMWAEKGVNLERAQEMLERALAQEPGNAAYLDSLGWIYFQRGNLPQAEKYLSEAARLLPRDATVQEHLGDVYAKRGDHARALELYKKALALDVEPADEAKLKTKIAQLEREPVGSR